MAQVLHLTGPVLVGPEDVRPQAWVVGGRITYAAPAGDHDVTTVPGWVLPGLVDAHSHIGLGPHGAVDDATAEEQALADRDAGALLLRDAGSPADTRWVQARDDLPRLVRAGRHIARTRRYIRNYAWEVEPEQLVDQVRLEARAGDGWVKLVGDWIDRDAGDLVAVLAGRRPRPGGRRGARGGRPGHRALLRRAVAARPRGRRHRLRRARVRPRRRHDRVVRGAGHRDRADAGQHRHLPADRRAGPREVPRLPPAHARPARAALRDDRGGARGRHPGLRRHGRRGLAAARPRRHRGGPPGARRASRRPRRSTPPAGVPAPWLGWPGLEEGEEADLVVYPEDPREDLAVLAAPSLVVLRGRPSLTDRSTAASADRRQVRPLADVRRGGLPVLVGRPLTWRDIIECYSTDNAGLIQTPTHRMGMRPPEAPPPSRATPQEQTPP